MKKTLSILFPALILGIHWATAQNVIFKNYTVQDGLAGNQIRRICQDSEGFMWFGSVEGLCKYDGYKFSKYSTPDNLHFDFINDIFEIEPFKLMITENDGTTEFIDHDNIIPQKFSGAIVNKVIKTGQGEIIGVADYKGICKWQNKQWKSLSLGNYSILDIASYKDSLYVTVGDGMLKLFNNKFEIIDSKTGAFILNVVFCDSKNRVWVGGTEGLLAINKDSLCKGRIHIDMLPSVFNSPILKKAMITAIFEDSFKNLWFGTGSGLVKVKPGGFMQVFAKENGLAANIIESIYEDREKNIWIGTTEGLSKLATANDVSILAIGQETNTTNTCGLLDGNDNDIYAYQHQSIKKINTSTLQITNFYGKAIFNKGCLTPFPIKYVLQGNKSPSRLIKNFFSFIPKHFEGYLAIQNNSLFLGNRAALVWYSTTNKRYDTILRNIVTSMSFDNAGNLWIGTWSAGLWCIQKSNKAPDVKEYSTLLPEKNIRTSFVDSKGNIWIGMRNTGVICMDIINRKTLHHFTKQNGLSSNWITCIAEDEAGNIWLGTNQGLDKLTPVSNTYRIFRFGWINNFPSFILDILVKPGNIIWCSSVIGIMRIEDKNLDTKPAIQPKLTSIATGNKQEELTWQLINQKLSLDYADNAIAFKYSVPSFINEKEILYSYRLLGGIDTNWSKPLNQHAVTYASLQPGHYQFQVRSLGWNSEWSTPASFVFLMLPPFWQTWWFYALIALFVMGITYAFYRYRITQLMQLQAVKNRIASDLHDDIGSSLTNINILSELTRHHIQQPESADKFISRIADEITASSQALDDIIWSVNVHNDSFDEVTLRMRRYAGELFDADKINYSISLDKTLAGLKMDMEQRRDLYLLFKEAVNNIHKHAAATHVSISIQKEGNAILMLIEDDGKGFCMKETHRNGLKNMQSRVQKWKGKLQVETAQGKGTKLGFAFPVK